MILGIIIIVGGIGLWIFLWSYYIHILDQKVLNAIYVSKTYHSSARYV